MFVAVEEDLVRAVAEGSEHQPVLLVAFVEVGTWCDEALRCLRYAKKKDIDGLCLANEGGGPVGFFVMVGVVHHWICDVWPCVPSRSASFRCRWVTSSSMPTFLAAL